MLRTPQPSPLPPHAQPHPTVQRRVQPSAATGLLLSAFLIVPLATACGGPPGGPQAEASESQVDGGARAREIPQVRPGSIEERVMVRVLDTTSRLESEKEVSLFPELPGTAMAILVEEGDAVQAGDVLARLDPRDEDLAVDDMKVALQEAKERLQTSGLAVDEATGLLESAIANARQAQRDYDRDVELFGSKATVSPLSKQALEQAKLESDQKRHSEEQSRIGLERRKLERDGAMTGIKRAEVALSRAVLNRAKKDIVAPFDGVISMRNIRIGDSVGTGQAAFVLTDTEHLRAVFSRPQEELGIFSNLGPTDDEAGSLSITATAEAYPGQTFEGYVERISPTIDASSGQFRVVARLRPVQDAAGTKLSKLLPGMLVRMKIIIDRHAQALVVPKRAVRREGDRSFVLLLDTQGADVSVRRVDITPSFEDDMNVEILPREAGKLKAGDAIILVGSRDLRDGDPVLVDKLESNVSGDDE